MHGTLFDAPVLSLCATEEERWRFCLPMLGLPIPFTMHVVIGFVGWGQISIAVGSATVRLFVG